MEDSPFLIIITDVDSRFKGRSNWFLFLDMLENAVFPEMLMQEVHIQMATWERIDGVTTKTRHVSETLGCI